MAAASIGMFVATFVWRFLTFTGFSNDHYAHLALAQQMLLGEHPIRDFSDPGWPLTYVVSALGWTRWVMRWQWSGSSSPRGSRWAQRLR